MVVLCCGDRDWSSWPLIWTNLRGLGPNTVIVEGDCRGADKMCGYVAKKLGYPVRCYPADWNGLGKRAGPARNREMYDKEQPGLVLAFHNDLTKSKGTKDMVEYARSKGCPVNVIFEEQDGKGKSRSPRSASLL